MSGTVMRYCGDPTCPQLWMQSTKMTAMARMPSMWASDEPELGLTTKRLIIRWLIARSLLIRQHLASGVPMLHANARSCHPPRFRRRAPAGVDRTGIAIRCLGVIAEQ